MTSHTGRLYALAIGVLVLFLAWTLVASKPFPSAKPSPQAQLIALREQALRRETSLVNQILRQRAVAAASRTAQLASAPAPPAPAVKVVTLPPLTITRTS